MLGTTTVDRRTKRHEGTKREILEAGWEAARELGLATLSLKDLARRVGMQAPSLYQYFPSKHAIYDAMFADGCRQQAAAFARIRWASDPREAVKQVARAFVSFAVEDPVRFQLLFQRTIPGFTPSLDSYTLAVANLQLARERLAAAGVTDPAHVDVWTALIGGLAGQQVTNEPAGDRWTRLVDEASDMFLDHVSRTPHARRRTP